MTRKLKGFGLLVAVLAIGAMAAQGASATTEHHFTSEVETTHITGTLHGGEHIFKAGILQWKCGSTALAGTQIAKTAEQIALTSTISGCKLGGTGVTIHNEGCKFRFNTTTTTNPAGTTEGESATTDRDCGHSGRMTVTAPGCDLEFSDTLSGGEGTVNQEIHGTNYSNANTSGETEITISQHNFGIRYRTFDTIAGACALIGKKEGIYADGTTQANFTLKGYSDAEHKTQVGISLNTT